MKISEMAAKKSEQAQDYDYNASLLDNAEEKLDDEPIADKVLEYAGDIISAPLKFAVDAAKSLGDYAVGAYQGMREVVTEGNYLAESNPLALSGTPMQEGMTNAPAPTQTEEQAQAGEAYKEAVGTFGEETVQVPAITVAGILAPEVTFAALTAMQAYAGYKEGGAMGAVRQATYGPLADWASQPDLEEKLESRPAATTINGILGLGQLAGVGFSALKAIKAVSKTAKPIKEEMKPKIEEVAEKGKLTEPEYASLKEETIAADKVISKPVEKAFPEQREGVQTYLEGSVKPGKSALEEGITVTRQEIVKEVSDIIPARTGRIADENVDGLFKVYPEVIRSRDYGNFGVYAHELGHYLDKKFGITQATDELIGKANELWGENKVYKGYSDGVKRAEGVAEFTRQYLLNPEEAAKNFPEFSKIFASELAKDAKLANSINDVGNKMRRWYEQSEGARVRGAISFATDDKLTTKENVTNLANRAYEAMIDDLDPLKRTKLAIEKYTGKKLNFDEDFYTKARMAKNEATLRSEMLLMDDPQVTQYVLNEVYGGKLKHAETIKGILDTLDPKVLNEKYPTYLTDNGSQNWTQAFSSLLTAKRTIELNKVKYLDVVEANKKAIAKIKANIKGLTEKIAEATDEAEIAKLNEQKTKAVEKLRDKSKEAREFEKEGYKLPIEVSDAEKVAANAPEELNAAAQKFYNYNDNLLAIAEDAGLISKKHLAELRKKYQNYSPMMRDFTDEGLQPVGNPLKRLSETGSTRTVIDPLESTLRDTYEILSKAESNKVRQTFVKAVSDKEGLGRFLEKVDGTTGDAKQSIFTVVENGEVTAYQTTPEMYRALTSMNKYSVDVVSALLQPFAKTLRIGATIGPDFMVANVIRDTLTASAYTDLGFKPVIDTSKGLFTLLNDKTMAAEYKAAGVPMSNFVGMDRAGLDKVIKNLMNDKKLGVKVAEGVIEGLRNMSEKSESATRMGVFKLAREKGMSIEEAGFLAKEATLDFSRAGSVGRKLNQAIPFFNAVIQGGDKLVRAIKENPVSTVEKSIAYITLPSLVLWTINHNEDWYKETADYIKNSNWLIKAGDEIIRIPKPFELGLFFGSSFERALDKMVDKDPDAMESWVKTAADGFLPSIFPTAIGPMIEWITNYSMFMDKNIVGMREAKLPKELQYTPYTSEFAKKIGKEFDLSPMKIDNTIGGYFGSAGKFVAGMGDFVIGDKKEMPTKRIAELPGIKRFTYDPYKHSKSLNDFYDKLEEANKQHAGYGTKGKVPAELQKMRKDAEKISDINKKNRAITVGNKSADEKRRLIDENTAKILEIVKKYRKGE